MVKKLNQFLRWLLTRSDQPVEFDKYRAKIVLFSFSAVFLVFIARAVFLQLIPSHGDNLESLAEKQYVRKFTLSKYRGSILDRRGEALAISVKRPSFYINPKTFKATVQDRKLLAQALHITQEKLNKLLKKTSHFRWLVRRATHRQALTLAQLKHLEIRETQEPARYYPSGEISASLIGIVGTDDKGLTGLEHSYNDTVSGEPVTVIESRDAHGNPILINQDIAQPEIPGNDLILTIDRAIQDIAFEKLKAGVLEAEAIRGMALVMDPHSGAILASVNYPSFDPNEVGSIDLESTRHLPFMNTFEPGSVLKPINLSLGTRLGKFNQETTENCENGRLQIGRHVIHDAHVMEKQILTLGEIVAHSSNVCTYKLIEKLGRKDIFENLKNFGFADSTLTHFQFPGLAKGRIQNPEKWSQIQFANIAFGQGLTTTALEVARAYSVFANGGRLVEPRIISRILTADGQVAKEFLPVITRQVLSSSGAEDWMNILKKVVNDGVFKARIAEYSTAGKTGTTQKVNSSTGTYSHEKHLASFVGIAPADDPHLVIYVQIDEPGKKPHYGSLWAAPVFRDIAEDSLHYLNVQPDSKANLATKQNTDINSVESSD